MRTTIHTFSEALLLPQHALRTLGACEVMLTMQGMPALHRTSMTIEPRFRRADDFYEGRAVVECEGGMGLIDRTGAYVLPPTYEIVEYLVTESILRVRQGGLWATFDLTGAQTSPFEELEAHEKQLIETN